MRSFEIDSRSYYFWNFSISANLIDRDGALDLLAIPDFADSLTTSTARRLKGPYYQSR